MKSSGSFGRRSSRRRALGVAVARVVVGGAAMAGAVAIVGGAVMSGTARGAVARSAAVAADRAYPVLADTGGTGSGTGTLTVIGPTWDVSLKLKDPGQIVIDPNGKYAYLPHGGVLTGTAAGKPKVAATWKLPFLPTFIAVSPTR